VHLHRARIGFDERGNVLAWDHAIVGQSITTGTVFGEFEVKNGIDATATEGMRDPYPFPMRRTVPPPDSVAGRNKGLALCVAQKLPFELPRRRPEDPAYPTARVQIEWDHIWPQARSSAIRIKRAPTGGPRRVWARPVCWLVRSTGAGRGGSWAELSLPVLPRV